MAEIWKKIEGFNNYMVSNTQKIRNIKTGTIIDTTDFKENSAGHIMVSLTDDKEKKKNVTFSNMVASVFVDNPENKTMVWHKDRDKTNNVPENLMYVNWDDMAKLKTPAKTHNQHPIIRLISETEKEQIFESSYAAAEWVREQGLSNSDQIAGRITNICNTNESIYGSMWEYYIEEINDEEWEKHPTLDIECSNRDRVKNHYKLLLGGKTIKMGNIKYQKSRLIYEAFNGLIDNDDVIDHKDRNRSNNNLDNLERVTQAENIERTNGKEVYQFSKDRVTFIKEFRSTREAERELNICHISSCAKGDNESAGNYYFSYKHNLPKEIIEAGKKYRKIYQYDKNKKKLEGKYEDAFAVAKAIGKPVTNIRKCADGEARSAFGYYWSWEILKVYKHFENRETIQSYDSIQDAARSIGRVKDEDIKKIKEYIDTDEVAFGYIWATIDYTYEDSIMEEVD